MTPISNLPAEELSRLKKILALRDGSSNPNEVAVAASKAIEILQRYNLELSEFELQLEPDEEKSAVDTLNTGITIDGALHTWLLVLVRTVSKSCLVEPYILFGNLAFIGRKRETEAARMIFSELYTQMLAMEPLAQRKFAAGFKAQYGISYWDQRNLGNPKKIKRDWSKSWLLGCARGIHDTLEQQFQEFVANSQANALVVVRTDEIKQYLHDQGLDNGKSKHVMAHDQHVSGYASGIQTGRQLGQTVGKKKLTE